MVTPRYVESSVCLVNIKQPPLYNIISPYLKKTKFFFFLKWFYCKIIKFDTIIKTFRLLQAPVMAIFSKHYCINHTSYQVWKNVYPHHHPSQEQSNIFSLFTDMGTKYFLPSIGTYMDFMHTHYTYAYAYKFMCISNYFIL